MQVFKGLSTQSPNPFTLLSIDLSNHYAPLMYETTNILQNSSLTHLTNVRDCVSFVHPFLAYYSIRRFIKKKLWKLLSQKKIANFTNNKSFLFNFWSITTSQTGFISRRHLIQVYFYCEEYVASFMVVPYCFNQFWIHTPYHGSYLIWCNG